MMHGRVRQIVIGVLLLGGVAAPGVVGWWLGARHEAAVENLQREVKRLRAEERSTGLGSRRILARERIDALQGQLEGRDRLSARVDQLHRIADGYGVRIGKANYKVHPAQSASGGIGRYELRIESDATYYELRFFLRDLLAADPMLAIESIDLRRAAAGGYNAGGKPILATLNIVMYFGSTE